MARRYRIAVDLEPEHIEALERWHDARLSKALVQRHIDGVLATDLDILMRDLEIERDNALTAGRAA